MKLERLSKNKIKYSISFEELSDKGFLEEEFESFIWHDLFDEMVEVATKEYQFEVPDTISIEIFSLNSSEIVLILTIDDISESEDSTEKNIIKPDRMNEIFCFESIEDVISLSICLENLQHKALAKLYVFEDIYYLILNNEKMGPWHVLIEEYGTSSEISLFFLEEYGHLIIEDHAFAVLHSYFKK